MSSQSKAETSESAETGRPKTHDQTLSTKGRSIATVMLVMHLFCLAIVSASVLPTSDLGARLLSIFAPYLRISVLDLDYTPYYLTRETLNNDTLSIYAEREYVIEYQPEDADPTNEDDWVRIDTHFSKFSSVNVRLRRYASTIGYFVDEETEVARFVRDMVVYLVEHEGERPIRIRVRQHAPVPRERYYLPSNELPDPESPIFYAERYTALVVYGEQGTIDVMKDVPANEAALIRN